jgi:hypothetical protein
MKSTLPNDLLKSKSQAASHTTTQNMKAATPEFSDKRPEAILQKKMQETANGSAQVMQLQALQAMANRAQQASSKNVVQLIQGDKEITNTYSEVRIKKPEEEQDNKKKRKRDDTDVDGLKTDEKTLVKKKVKGAGSTSEDGYRVLNLEEGEQQEDWQIMNSVLKWDEEGALCTRNNFNLPVSCIESAEHVIHHKDKEQIPNYKHGKKNKKVGLFFGKDNKETQENKLAAKLSSRDLSLVGKTWVDYDFKSDPAQVGEGLFVQNTESRSLFHAVAVVGKNNKNGQLIVLERNAGTTTGDNMYLDKKWLVNVYNSESAFKGTLESEKDKHWRIGKLKAL